MSKRIKSKNFFSIELERFFIKPGTVMELFEIVKDVTTSSLMISEKRDITCKFFRKYPLGFRPVK